MRKLRSSCWREGANGGEGEVLFKMAAGFNLLLDLNVLYQPVSHYAPFLKCPTFNPALKRGRLTLRERGKTKFK